MRDHPRPVSPERELVWLLAGTEARRRRFEQRIRELARRTPVETLVGELDRHRLRLVLGSRLQEFGLSTAEFDEYLTELRHFAEARGLLLESVMRQVCDSLEERGIPALPVKDVYFAQRVYGQAGVRMSQDLDILVPRHQLEAAVALVKRQGYEDDPAEPWSAFHAALRPHDDWKPQIEIHWRLHWYGDRFAARMLADSHLGEEGIRQASPEATLVALLVYYARDGFAGLRLATDIASFWDLTSGSVPLASVLAYADSDPELHTLVRASAVAARSVVGIDWDAPPSMLPRDGRIATRLANWPLSGDVDQIQATVRLVDALLEPDKNGVRFVRSRFRPFTSRTRNVLYAVKTFARWVPAIASVLGGRVPHPPPVTIARGSEGELPRRSLGG